MVALFLKSPNLWIGRSLNLHYYGLISWNPHYYILELDINFQFWLWQLDYNKYINKFFIIIYKMMQLTLTHIQINHTKQKKKKKQKTQ